MSELPPLPARLRESRVLSTGICARPNCRRAAVIQLDWSGLVISLCADHADSRAADPGAHIEWLANGWGACPICGRVLPSRLVDSPHFDGHGRACPS